MLARTTGLVGFRNQEQTICLRLRSGHLISAASTRRSGDEILLRTLLESGQLTPDPKLREVVGECQQTGAPLDRALHRHGIVPAQTIAHVEREAYCALAIEATTLEDAECIVGPSETVGESQLPAIFDLDLRPVLAREVRERLKHMFYRELEPAMAPAGRGWLTIDPAAEPLLEAIGMNKRERHAIDHTLDGRYGLTDVMRVAVLSKNEMARLLILLFLFGAVRQSSTRLGVEGGVDRRLQLQHLRALDHFAQLGAHWSSPPQDLRDGLAARKRELHASGPLDAMGQETLAILEHAWTVVSEEKRRVAYRHTLVEDTQLVHSADLLAIQARTADFRGNLPGSIRLFETAYELCPTEELRRQLNEVRDKRPTWSQA